MTFEIDLTKLERGTKTEWRTVRRDGTTFKQRFAVGKKDVDDTPDTSMTKESLTEMISAYTVAPGDEITGTLHQGDLYRCTFDNGVEGIHKVMDDTAIKGETLYYKINKILAFNTCPETVEANFGKGPGSCQRWIAYWFLKKWVVFIGMIWNH